MNVIWSYEQNGINWSELAELYRIAPLGQKLPADLELVFTNSRFKCFVFDGSRLIGVGRALADSADCSCICDISVHPDYQGIGLGKKIVQYLVNQSKDHTKIILYANPGKEGFYAKLGFKKMNTAMAIFRNEETAINKGIISEL
ncbi:MAG: GNAT family N-acetyltransferase [Desulfococcaceae bacterium]|jgi:GNAT superfamily N-acetyltransferase|nr:GNAT family N-acetyltransferase [Desulfococcaceae bacterium]